MGTEPVGALKPKISTIDVTRVVPTDRGFALLCPAQAFPNRLEPPSPSSHRVTKVAPLKTSSPRVSPSCVRPKHIPCLSLEPVGSTKPKVSGDKIQGLEGTSGSDVTLLCPAQAFPVPFYRTGWAEIAFIFVRPEE
ncbi:hypothetical protein M8J76_002195 [Diaphorina citri]|nr:hypothetical protein M8J76_002195 [Diaphorina citri]